jgi:hypothetical protein
MIQNRSSLEPTGPLALYDAKLQRLQHRPVPFRDSQVLTDDAHSRSPVVPSPQIPVPSTILDHVTRTLPLIPIHRWPSLHSPCQLTTPPTTATTTRRSRLPGRPRRLACGGARTLASATVALAGRGGAAARLVLLEMVPCQHLLLAAALGWIALFDFREAQQRAVGARDDVAHFFLCLKKGYQASAV